MQRIETFGTISNCCIVRGQEGQDGLGGGSDVGDGELATCTAAYVR